VCASVLGQCLHAGMLQQAHNRSMGLLLLLGLLAKPCTCSLPAAEAVIPAVYTFQLTACWILVVHILIICACCMRHAAMCMHAACHQLCCSSSSCFSVVCVCVQDDSSLGGPATTDDMMEDSSRGVQLFVSARRAVQARMAQKVARTEYFPLPVNSSGMMVSAAAGWSSHTSPTSYC
jgi:hypothetical protein